MSINVKTENVNDATVQVHIAFENASRYHNRPKRRHATRSFNHARLRDGRPMELTVGRNKAAHRSSTKAKLLAETDTPEYLPPASIAGPRPRHPA